MSYDKIRDMVESSDNVRLKKSDSWWFDRESQRKHIFEITTRLVVEADHEVAHALEKAEDIVQQFYERHVQTTTRIK